MSTQITTLPNFDTKLYFFDNILSLKNHSFCRRMWSVITCIICQVLLLTHYVSTSICLDFDNMLTNTPIFLFVYNTVWIMYASINICYLMNLVWYFFLLWSCNRTPHTHIFLSCLSQLYILILRIIHFNIIKKSN